MAMEVAGCFKFDETKAAEIAAHVGNAVAKWHHEAARLGVKTKEMDRMASAFEHDDLRMSSAK